MTAMKVLSVPVECIEVILLLSIRQQLNGLISCRSIESIMNKYPM